MGKRRGHARVSGRDLPFCNSVANPDHFSCAMAAKTVANCRPAIARQIATFFMRGSPEKWSGSASLSQRGKFQPFAMCRGRRNGRKMLRYCSPAFCDRFCLSGCTIIVSNRVTSASGPIVVVSNRAPVRLARAPTLAPAAPDPALTPVTRFAPGQSRESVGLKPHDGCIDKSVMGCFGAKYFGCLVIRWRISCPSDKDGGVIARKIAHRNIEWEKGCST